MSTIGHSFPRIDAESKVSGKALYPGDFNFPDQAMMKILFTNHPHAIIKRIDTSEAERMEGVLGIFTAKDVPVNEYGLSMPDQPVLCGPGSSKPFADHVRFIGDKVAVVVAESERLAQNALNKIVVEYEDLPVITDPMQAMRSDSIRLHPDKESNTLCHYQIRKGNIEQGFKDSDVIVEGYYHTPAQEHAYLQPEAGVSYIDEEGRVTIIVAGQWTHTDRDQITHALGLPSDRVRIIYPAIGGAFGGREDMSVQIVLALASWRFSQRGIYRPIKMIWSREESIIGHHKRHPYIIKARWGASKEGKIKAAEVDVIADGGAYASTSPKVLGNATLMCTGPYEIPNVKVDACAVYTNNIPTGAFRGFGGPQGAFAAESQINKLANVLKMDAVEIRARNCLTEGALLSVGSPLPGSISIGKVIEECALQSGWEQTDEGWKEIAHPLSQTLLTKSYLKHGVGFACAFKNIGFSFGAKEKCTAIIELHGKSEIEKVILRHAAAEVGQGVHTVMVQMTAEALNVPIEIVEIEPSDTARTENSGSVSASRMTLMSGNSIKGAAHAALDKWFNEERPAIGQFTYFAPKTTPYDPQTGESNPNFAYGYVAESVEVEVDTETGNIRVVKVVCVDDVGKAINPMLIEGQIEGAIIQALGYGVYENFIQENGYVTTKKLSTYLIPTILDIPERVESYILEKENPIGPWGARGMGEMPLLPFVPALTNAVFNATGVWFDHFPLTPEVVLRGLGKII